MKDQVFAVEYFAVTADDRPGAGADLGAKLGQEGINLLALSAFPVGPGKTQVDIVPENPEKLTKAAKKLGLTLGAPKVAFLVQGTDRAGATGEVLARLGNARINVRAALSVGGGGNRYGGLIWVEQDDIEAATRALGATTMTAHHV
jgi:predicted amino acid-binding ACT domain protein